MTNRNQVDLFLESLINTPIKDERALMEFPFFSLQKRPRLEPIEYNDGTVSIKIEPGPRGIATIWDKDILIYVASLINDRIERNQPVDRTVRFNAYDLLRVTERGTGAQAYRLLDAAMFRLRSTNITTTIKAGEVEERRGFGWISDFRIITRTTKGGKEIMAACEVDLNRWLFRAIVQDRRVLTISRDYFKLGKGLERRLYELARKHCGRQERWIISLPKLQQKCGSVRDLRKFKADLQEIAEADTLPDYQLALNFDPKDRARQEAEGLDARRWATNERVLVAFWPRSVIGVDYINGAETR